MEPSANPFAVLSLIVAPAILTNAASVLVMSTSNRLARAVDRARTLSKELEQEEGSAENPRRLRELSGAEQRALLLLRGLRCFYVAMGCFASAALVSLLGAVVANLVHISVLRTLEVLGVTAGLLAVAAIVYGSFILLQETRIAVDILTQRAAEARELAARWEQTQRESSIQA
jgi:hypothetical protein